MAIPYIVDAISNIHTYWLDVWMGKSVDKWEGTPDNARRALENLLDLIHLCIDMFPNEWRKTYAWGDKINDDTGALELYFQNALS